MKKLPKYLYHYTAYDRMGWIVEDEMLKPSPSSLKMDASARHREPVMRNGKVVGDRYVDQYADYHPVVWLTANDAAVDEETGLNAFKMVVRFVIPTEALKFHILPWCDFTKKYHASPDTVRALKQDHGKDWKNWYVCERPIDLRFAERVEIRQKDGSYKVEQYFQKQ